MTPDAIKPTQSYPWFAKRRNIILLVFCFFLLCATTSLFLCHKHYQDTTQQALRDDRFIAGLYALILEEHLQRIVKTMESYTNRPLLPQAVRQKNAKKAAEKDTAIHVAVPIFDENGTVIGLLQNTQRAVRLNKIIEQITLGEEGLSISVTDRKGQIICSTRYAYARELVLYPFHEIIGDKKTSPNQSVAVSEPSAGGLNGYISSAPLTGVGWNVFVERDRRSILSRSSTYFLQIAVIFVLLFLTVTLSLMYFRKRVMAETALDNLRTEKELLASETRFRELFDHMSSGVAVYETVDDGEDFIISDLNAAGRKITGVTGDIIGKRVRDVFPGVEYFGLFRIFQQVWRTGVAASHPNSRYQDGRLAFWTGNYVYKLPSGQIVAVFDDITERAQAEKALRESEQKYRLLLDEMISGCAVHEIICDQTGKPVDYRSLSVNAAFEKMTGHLAAAVIGRTVLEVMPATEQIWIERYGKVALTGEPARFEDYSHEVKNILKCVPSARKRGSSP